MIFFKMFTVTYFTTLETQSIRRVRSKLKDISKILKDVGGLLGKDENNFEIKIYHPGNKTEASFQIERLDNQISVNIVQPLGEVENIALSLAWKRCYNLAIFVEARLVTTRRKQTGRGDTQQLRVSLL